MLFYSTSIPQEAPYAVVAVPTEEPSQPESGDKTIEIHLATGDFQILEKYRGDLSPDVFIASLLRMIDGGAVSGTPDWVKKKKEH